MREEEKFSKRPVQQLAIIKEANILVSLSDNYVSLHDLQTYALQERLEKTKGATSFAVMSNIVKDDDTGIPLIVSRLAVAVKRRILLWSWQDMESSDDATEITLVAAAKSLTWSTGTKIVAGLDSGFVVVDIETREVTDITKPGSLEDAGSKFGAVSSTGMSYVGMGSWVPKPMATKLAEGEMLLAKDVNTLFIDATGTPLDKRQVPWHTAPEAIGYSYPYLLALHGSGKGTLEIRNPDTLSLLQSAPVPNASILHVPQPNISLAHAGKGFLVSSDRCIWRMSALKYESQIEQLTSQALYDEAISLINMLEDTLLLDKDARLRDIKIMKARALFDQRKYRESMELFAEASTPPKEVVSLYPKSIAGILSSIDGEEPLQKDNDAGETEQAIESKKSPPGSPPSAPQKGLLGSLRLRPDTKKLDPDTASIKSSRTTDTADTNSARGKPQDGSSDKALEGRELLVATNELCAFLAQTRVKLQKIIYPDGSFRRPFPENPPKDYQPEFRNLIVLEPEEQDVDWHKKLLEVATLVDTTLFRAYMLAKPGLAGSLFRLDNFCDPAVVRDKLYQTGRYGDLIDFLHGKKLHREALEMLEKFGKDTENESISQQLRGPRRTVAYLQQLPPEQIDLILEFSEWPLRKDPELGMDVFIADTENAETLPRQSVLEFLQRISSKLAITYLDHVVTELNDVTVEFHQRLVELYLERLKFGKESRPDYGGFASEKEKDDCKEKLEGFLKSSAHYNRVRVFTQLPADGKSLDYTIIERVLIFVDPDFYESRAIVLSTMGQHKQALQIYVFQLKDPQKAEEYCNQTYLAEHDPSGPVPGVPTTKSAKDDTPSIYHTLLSIYLNPPTPYEPQLEPALALLSAHGARLPASQTLALIPASLSIATLESYFRGRMRAAVSKMNEERVAAQLRAVRQARVDEKLVLAKNRSVTVGEDRLCPVCMKRFGNSAVRVYPDGKVVHYGCFNRGQANTAGTWGRRESGIGKWS
jgi:tetratricopeptide (TPR) repeat protein